MVRYKIKMPDVGEGITEAEIVEWNVEEGDFVREDDILGAVMTDKATVEIPSPVTGTVQSLTGKLGEMTAVGAEIIALEVDEGSKEAVPREAKETAAPFATSHEEDELDEPKEVVSTVEPSAPEDTADEDSDPASSEPDDTPTLTRRLATGLQASPSVRKRAQDIGIDLSDVAGSGPEGRIQHSDLDAFLAGGEIVVPPAPQRRLVKDGVEEWKVFGLRRKIAERMQDAKRRIPHITYVEEIDVTDLEKLRKHMKSVSPAGKAKLTILPFIMRAMTLAVADVPKISAHFDDEKDVVQQFEAVHIGMATQTEAGLMVPVIKHAEALSVKELAEEIDRLADTARNGSITREELTGSTITLSSLGAMGGIVSTPVINSPEVAIVGVNKMVERPVYVDGVLVPRKIMNLSSSFDHRIVDGWDAAVYIQKIKSLLEHPALLFVD